MRLSDILHQDEALRRIQRAISTGRMPHAMIFSGPEGIGKELAAIRLAAVLLCSSPSIEKRGGDTWQESCGACVDCELMNAGNHPDFHRIHRTLNKMHPDASVQRRKAVDLGIDVIRHFVIDKIGMRPSRERAKVYVIAEADKLNPSSQNALLKTLEEPPEHSYIILLTPSPDVLLDTTRSRCRQIGFRALPSQFIREKLMKEHGADERTANFLAELSQGSAGRAIQYLQLGIFELVPSILSGVVKADHDPLSFGAALQDLAKKMTSRLKSSGSRDDSDDEENADTNLNRLGQSILLWVTSAILRDVLRMASGAPSVVLPGEPATQSLATGTSPESIRSAIKSLNSAEYQIGRSVNAGLIFDNVGLSVGRAFQKSAVRA